MIDEPLIYLVVERIKQLNSSGISVEEIDCQLNLLDYVLFNTNKSKNKSKLEYIDYEIQLIKSYLRLDREDYLDIGIESNVWFLKLINDHINEEKNNLINSENINRLSYLYVKLEHPYCRYLLMMIYSSLSKMNRELNFHYFINNIMTQYKIQYSDIYFEGHEEHIDAERKAFEEEMETVLHDIKKENKEEGN